MLDWKKQGDGFRAAVGPFVATAIPKGDGRWSWAVHADGADNPQATGIGSSAGAAKTAADQYVRRSGRV